MPAGPAQASPNCPDSIIKRIRRNIPVPDSTQPATAHPVLFIPFILFILSQGVSLTAEFRPKTESGETFSSLNVRSFHPVYPVHLC